MTNETPGGAAQPEHEALPQPDGAEVEREESEFEGAVKGIGQGIAGKFKEMVGEFIGDPNLEQEGIVQQIDGRIRRAEAEQPPSEEQTTP